VSARPYRLTPYIAPEDDLAASLPQALRVLLPQDQALYTAWDISNARSAAEGARKKRIGCLAGWPDGAVWHRGGGVVLLELKRERGWQLSDAQKALHQRLASLGHPVSVVHSVAQVLDVLRDRGVVLRGRVAA
jgi:hypothetical protein